MTSTDVANCLRDLANNLWSAEYRIRVDEDASLLLAAAEEIDRLQRIIDSRPTN